MPKSYINLGLIPDSRATAALEKVYTTVLRTMIRRTAPETITVGRGFVLTQDHQSTEIDILLYDSSYPVLYKEGDLVFISPAACRGIVEVKSRLGLAKLQAAPSKLAAVAEFIRMSHLGPVFVGLMNLRERRRESYLYFRRLQRARNVG